MTTAIPKLGAMAGAACLLATMALPAHASSLPETTDGIIASQTAQAAQALAAQSPAAQTFAVGAIEQVAATSTLARATAAATAIPVPVAPAPVAPPVVSTSAASARAAAASSSAVAQPAAIAAPAASSSGSAILDYASTFVGVVPYGMGNTPDTSFSCDGFVQYVFSAFGYSLPRGADHQAAVGTPISRSEAVAGDLVWWPGQHIGIYDGAGGMYDSPNWGRFVQHPAQLWGSPSFIRLG